MQAQEYRINWEIYTLYAGAAGMLLPRNGKFTIGKLKSSRRKVLFSIDPYCQFLDVSQDMRPTYLYLMYPLSLVQWDRCVRHSHQILNYLVKVIQFHSTTF